MKRKLPPLRRAAFGKRLLFFLLGLYLFLSPISVSGLFRAQEEFLKWGRVGLLALCFLLGLRYRKKLTSADASFWLNALAVVFWISGMWSKSPTWALAYKGLFVGSCITGQALAGSLTQREDTVSFGRTMVVFTNLGLIGLVGLLVTTDRPLFINNRLFIDELNPNLLAQSCSIFSLLCLFHNRVEPAQVWRFSGLFAIAVCGVIILLSGSRGAFAMLVGGVAVFAALRFRDAKFGGITAILATALAIGAGVFAVQFAEPESNPNDSLASSVGLRQQGSLRMWNEAFQDTRFEVWGDAIELWKESPVIGIGWHSRRRKWLPVQSAYVQVLVECGLIGGFFLLAFFGSFAGRLRRLVRNRRRAGAFVLMYAAVAFALLVHGLVESSAVLGSSANSVLLSFSVAHVDIFVRSLKRQRAIASEPSVAQQPQMNSRRLGHPSFES